MGVPPAPDHNFAPASTFKFKHGQGGPIGGASTSIIFPERINTFVIPEGFPAVTIQEAPFHILQMAELQLPEVVEP